MIRKLISELGLRYPPSGEADLAAHTGRVAMLMQDVAMVPAQYLEIAIGRWVTSNPWLPKACDLIQLAHDAAFKQRQPAQDRSVNADEAEHRYREAYAEKLNAGMGGDRPDRGFRWYWDRARKEMQMLSHDDWAVLTGPRDVPEGRHILVHMRAI